MSEIQTLGGALDTGDLGRVLMHEHIFNLSPEVQGCYPGYHGWDPEVCQRPRLLPGDSALCDRRYRR